MNIATMCQEIKAEIKARIRNENCDKSFAGIVGAVYPELVMLGKGSFGAVFLHEEDHSKVYRISFSPQFDNWFKVAQFAMETGSEYFTRVFEMDTTEYMVGIAVIERLHRMPDVYHHLFLPYQSAMNTRCDIEFEAYRLANNKIGFTMDHHVELMKLKQHLSGTNIKFRWDLFSRNFMLRGDTLVITDPIS